MNNSPAALLRKAFAVALEAVRPEACLSEHWPVLPADRLRLLAIGKAGAAMARAAANHYGPGISGLVLVPDGHAVDIDLPAGLEVLESAHPLPDQRSIRSADAALALVAELKESDRLLVLLSGGGSAVMAKPLPGITLAHKRNLTRQLQDRGADIAALNGVRSQLSAVKGGRLVAGCRAPVLTLAISDVPGDDPTLIASGPTMATRSNAQEALVTLERYGAEVLPQVFSLLRSSTLPAAQVRPDDSYRVVANGQTMLAAAQAWLEAQGIRVINLGDGLNGDARALAMEHAELISGLATSGNPVALLSGGETTVALQKSGGRGGRNTEYLLQLAIALQGLRDTWALAADSDGIDGHGGHAGALLAPDTLARAATCGMNAAHFLQQHDSASLFDALGDLLVTGPTRTNVNDFRVLLYLP